MAGDKLVLISLDGCGVYNLRHMPFLRSLMREGKSAIVRSMFPTLTDLVHTTVMTGVEPRVHGIVENGYYDRTEDRKVNFYDYEVAFNPHSVIRAPTVVDILRKEGVLTASVSGYTMPPFSGTDVRIFPPFFSNDSMYRKHGRDWRKDVWVLNSALYLYEECHPDLLLVHFASIDGMQHEYGPMSEGALKAVRTVDEAVRTLWTKLKDEYSFMILADHGQEKVHTWVNLREYLRRKGIETRRVSSGGGVHVYLRDPGERYEAAEVLGRAPGVGAVFLREELPYLDCPASGEILVSARPGYWFCSHSKCRGIKGVSYWVRGMHGSLNEDVVKVPLVLWGFEGWEVSVEGSEGGLMNVAPTVLRFFDVEKPRDMTGKSMIA
ncbi:MAG: alkaline phosphatase family protein [Thermococci archaeon]|nr:alkaline phosphatase family protein [Thermococci archaeon]